MFNWIGFLEPRIELLFQKLALSGNQFQFFFTIFKTVDYRNTSENNIF